MSDTVAYCFLIISGCGCLSWGGSSLLNGEFHGRYRFTNKKYIYRKVDQPWHYWSETLTVLLGGLFCICIGMWAILH
ncbi:hypothetical protein RHD99_13895 [Buttiauxella selenatireducens]|uniref:Uncharacterized protein n=1 Tax=Buttiauxella selenatireducens TaxID=3073902 RepID=A0ABY9S4Y8_9ENTR|nr:hypothetical protein [Buttiauxella sp. R73]WMY72572.1 hypothetical protein RHD99_13895 [Buttiauxella sp. R73]